MRKLHRKYGGAAPRRAGKVAASVPAVAVEAVADSSRLLESETTTFSDNLWGVEDSGSESLAFTDPWSDGGAESPASPGGAGVDDLLLAAWPLPAAPGWAADDTFGFAL